MSIFVADFQDMHGKEKSLTYKFMYYGLCSTSGLCNKLYNVILTAFDRKNLEVLVWIITEADNYLGVHN